MFNDFNLAKLPPYGKTFVGLFACLVMVVIVWMMIVDLMEWEVLGEKAETFEEYDIAADMETIMADDRAVTPPVWSDSGQQEPIEPSDIERFKEAAEPGMSFLSRFEENAGRALKHVSVRTLLYFAIGLMFMFTTVSPKAKKLFYWSLAILMILHFIGLTGRGFCWPADALIYICSPLILILLFAMAIVILVNMRKINIFEI